MGKPGFPTPLPAGGPGPQAGGWGNQVPPSPRPREGLGGHSPHRRTLLSHCGCAPEACAPGPRPQEGLGGHSPPRNSLCVSRTVAVNPFLTHSIVGVGVVSTTRRAQMMTVLSSFRRPCRTGQCRFRANTFQITGGTRSPPGGEGWRAAGPPPTGCFPPAAGGPSVLRQAAGPPRAGKGVCGEAKPPCTPPPRTSCQIS